MEHQAYRCCLPTLAGFAGNHCIGPGFQRRPVVGSPTSPPRRGIRPSCSGLLVQGTANSPPSTTKLFPGVEALLRSAVTIPCASFTPKTFGAGKRSYTNTSKNWSRWLRKLSERPAPNMLGMFGVALPTMPNIPQEFFDVTPALLYLQGSFRSPSRRQCLKLFPTCHRDRQHS